MTIDDIQIMVCVPHDIYFATEVEIQINNMRQFNYSKQLTVLVFEEQKDTQDLYKEYWNQLSERYKEVTFKYYTSRNFDQLLKVYPQITRPWMMSEYWKEFPQTENNNVLYLDSDVLFTRPVDFSVFNDDSICYLSKTDYISAKYFESKSKDVMFHKQHEFKLVDVLERCCNTIGIDKQLVIDNQENTGGCQYLLRGIDQEFWIDVMNYCIQLRIQVQGINQQFFPSEEKGFQSWAIADMCGLLWNLWKRGIKTECPEEMNFSWSSSPIEEYDKCLFFHNAGVNSKFIEIDGKKHRMFYKADTRFRSGALSMFDIDNFGEISTDYCSYKYVEAIKDVIDPICTTKIFHY